MRSIDKVVIGGVVAASVVVSNYGIVSADLQDVYVSTARLNMRKGPSTDYASVGVLPLGTKVNIIEKSQDGQWAKIKYQNNEIWVSFQYLQKQKVETGTDKKQIKLNIKYKTTSGLNFRKGPSTDYVKIGYVSKGSIVVPAEASSDGSWVKITFDGKTGWISAEYISEYVEKPQSEVTAPNKVEVGETYKTTTALNARKGPASSYEVVTILKKGQEVVPLELTKLGYWTKIKFNDQFMYVCTTYLEKAVPKKDDDNETVEKVYLYTTSNLNLRKNAGTQYEKICTIPKNKKVEVIGYSSDLKWCKVVYNNKTGWVSKDYLSVKEAEVVDKTPVGVTKYTLNMRKGPSTDYLVVVKIPQGSTVRLYEEKDGWVKVKYKSYEGYCAAEYIDKK